MESGIIYNLDYSLLSDETIIKRSHVRITRPQLLINNEPVEYGLNDLHLGSTDDATPCRTCRNTKKLCPGHSGHYMLKYPIIKPLFFNNPLQTIYLKIFCFYCSGFILDRKHVKAIVDNAKGEPMNILKSLASIKTTSGTCANCDKEIIKLAKSADKDLFIYTKNQEMSDNKSIIYTHLIENYLTKISDDDLKMIGINYKVNHPKNIIMNVLYIPPNNIRPDVRLAGNEKISTDQLTIYLQTIIRQSELIIPVPSDSKDIAQANLDKIKIVNRLIQDMICGGGASQKTMHGDFKPVIERFRGKTGILRLNMLGLRTHNMGRAVIRDEDSLPLNYIVIPFEFAKSVQIPEKVNEYNIDILSMYIKNGIEGYPGATKVEKTLTRKTYNVKFAKNIILEHGDIVHRDLIDGDICGFNRQPSLIYCSITAVKVIINRDPKDKTIGMNVNTCKYYNADFDG